MQLPEWATEVPENCVFYMMEELTVRYNVPLTHQLLTAYDPNDKEKGKGRKIVLVRKSDLVTKHCYDCGGAEKNGHFSFQCPNDPYRELMEAKVINGVKMIQYYDFCKKSDDHFTWRCPDLEYIPFDPSKKKDFICEICGVEGEHWTDVYPEEIGGSPKREPGSRECLICRKYDDSEHWTQDCPELLKGDNKFCFSCEELGHSTDNCSKSCETVIFCECCETARDHLTEDFPKLTNDGHQYCEHCKCMEDHSTSFFPMKW